MRYTIVTCSLLLLVGCATFQNTPKQDFARAAWDSCPSMPNIVLDNIAPDGMIYYHWINSPAGTREHWACIERYYKEHAPTVSEAAK